VDKIYRFNRRQGAVFIAGSGPYSVISKFIIAAEHVVNDNVDLALEHLHLLEDCLTTTYTNYAIPTGQDIGLIVVIAFHKSGMAPLLYKSEGQMLVREFLYASHGTGHVISDYLSDRLYSHGLDKPSMCALAAFILREAEASTSGVGLGADMVFIHETGKDFHFIHTDRIKEIQDMLPKLGEAIWPYWAQDLKLPQWTQES